LAKSWGGWPSIAVIASVKDGDPSPPLEEANPAAARLISNAVLSDEADQSEGDEAAQEE